MDELTLYIERLKAEVNTIPSTDVKSRSDTRRLRESVNTVQIICQHIFTEIKSVNRTLPG